MAITELDVLLATLSPAVRPGRFCFVTSGAPLDAEATVREAEGLSQIVPTATAESAGLDFDGVFAWITCEVNSSLDAVGMTAAISRALSERRIPCNVVAGRHHDHLLVPEARLDEALDALARLTSG